MPDVNTGELQMKPKTTQKIYIYIMSDLMTGKIPIEQNTTQ